MPTGLKFWRGKYCVSPKRWHLPTSLYNAKTQKNIIIFTAVKTSYLTPCKTDIVLWKHCVPSPGLCCSLISCSIANVCPFFYTYVLITNSCLSDARNVQNLTSLNALHNGLWRTVGNDIRDACWELFVLLCAETPTRAVTFWETECAVGRSPELMTNRTVILWRHVKYTMS